MKVKITIHQMGSQDSGSAKTTVRFAGTTSGKIYSQPFNGRVLTQPYEAVIQFLEDVQFYSATSDAPFNFELEAVPESAEVHFYA